MYEVANTGVVKINLLPSDIFDQLFFADSVADISNIFARNSPLFKSLILDEGWSERFRIIGGPEQEVL